MECWIQIVDRSSNNSGSAEDDFRSHDDAQNLKKAPVAFLRSARHGASSVMM